MNTVTHWGFGLARLMAAAVLSGVVMGAVVLLSLTVIVHWSV